MGGRFMGFSLAPNTDDHAATVATFADAWAAANERPYLSTSFWYSLGSARRMNCGGMPSGISGSLARMLRA